jgi:hypothetical protein
MAYTQVFAPKLLSCHGSWRGFDRFVFAFQGPAAYFGIEGPGLMAKQTLPATLPPRLISREAAAAYVSVSPNTFDEMVKSGKMPQAKAVTDRRKAWDVRELDLSIDNLPSTNATAVIDATWGDVDAL